MIIKQFKAGPIDANNYIVFDKSTREAILIDCSEVKDEILGAIKDLNAKVKHIILTHGHFDHVLGVNDMKKILNCDVMLHEADYELIQHIYDFAEEFQLKNIKIPQIDKFLQDGDTIKFGTSTIKVIHTPGHTKGSVCYLIEDDLFSGDTLFKECVGRTDLPGGSYDEIKHSVRDVLFTLHDKVVVHPGHGIMSTIGHEKKFNNEI